MSSLIREVKRQINSFYLTFFNTTKYRKIQKYCRTPAPNSTTVDSTFSHPREPHHNQNHIVPLSSIPQQHPIFFQVPKNHTIHNHVFLFFILFFLSFAANPLSLQLTSTSHVMSQATVVALWGFQVGKSNSTRMQNGRDYWVYFMVGYGGGWSVIVVALLETGTDWVRFYFILSRSLVRTLFP